MPPKRMSLKHAPAFQNHWASLPMDFLISAIADLLTPMPKQMACHSGLVNDYSIFINGFNRLESPPNMIE